MHELITCQALPGKHVIYMELELSYNVYFEKKTENYCLGIVACTC